MSLRVVPPSFGGKLDEKGVAQLQNYLKQLHEQLVFTLENLDAGNFTKSVQKRIASVTTGTTEADISDIRSQIIKTAEVIEQMEQSLTAQFASSYVAKADFNTYTETALNTININSKAVAAYFEEIDSVNEQMEVYRSYVKAGKLQDSPPVYGIEIGSFGAGASPYKTRYTENRLAFFRNDVEVAYFSDNVLHVGELNVNRIVMGDWEITSDEGLKLRWIGS